MHVVSAGVHDVDILAGVVFRRHLARIGQTGFFFDRQRIHVGAHEHDRPVAIFHQARQRRNRQARIVVFANVIGDLAADRFKFLRDHLGGAFLLGR